MAADIELIKSFIVKEFPQAREVGLSADSRLVEEEIIDSLGIFLIVGYLQDQFNVKIGPEDVTFENFATINTMVSLVASKAGQV